MGKIVSKALAVFTVVTALQSTASALPPPCQDPDLVRLEANYILAAQYIQKGDPEAVGAINTVAGTPTTVVPGEATFAILGLLRAADCLGDASYRDRAQLAMRYLLRVQDTDGGWYDQYRYEKPVLRSKSSAQTAQVLIAMNKLGFQRNSYNEMVSGAEFLLRLQDVANKTGQDDGLIGAGLDANRTYQTQRRTADNALAYQALKAAARWARLRKDGARQQRYDDAAALILDGINTVLKDPASAVWYAAVDAQGNSIATQHDWTNYAPQLFDVPAQGIGTTVGDWIYQTLVHQPEGAAVWNDGAESNRLSPRFSFQANLVWIDVHQFNHYDAAWQWARTSGLHQLSPDANGIAGGWIDWIETTGAQAPFSERLIGTSVFSILAATDGFNFNAE